MIRRKENRRVLSVREGVEDDYTRRYRPFDREPRNLHMPRSTARPDPYENEEPEESNQENDDFDFFYEDSDDESDDEPLFMHHRWW